MKNFRTFLVVLLGISGVAVLLYGRQITESVRKTSLLNRTIRHALTKKPPCPECNILLINLDTLRPSEMPCYGYFRDTSPNLCAYAASNQRFTNFYTQTSFTLDSHMSIFTGLYPSTHHMVEALKDFLNPAIPTLAKTLKDNGYHTVWAGVTDDVNLPLDRGMGTGFDEFYTVDGKEPDWVSKYVKLLPKFLEDKPTFMFLHSYGVHSPYLVGKGPYRFLTRVKPSVPLTEDEFQAKSRGFFEFVLAEFTDRLRASNTKESKERNGEIVRELARAIRANDLEKAEQIIWEFPGYESYSLYMSWYYRQLSEVGTAVDAATIEYLKTLYDERIYQVDQQLMPLFAFLNRPEVKKKTIVIFLSDNGEEFMEHGFLDHGWNIYNTATHAPLILAVPGMMQGVHHDLVQAIDIMPTLLDLVGIPAQGPMEGISFLPLLEGRGLSYVGERYLIGQYSGGDIVSIRNSRWKMYKNTKPRAYVELFDLLKDPLEQNNVLGDHLDIAGRLDQALTRQLNASPKYAPITGDFPSWLDEEKRNSLKNAGYF